MDWTILSEIFRNTALPVLGAAGAFLAIVQYRSSQSRNSFDRLHKAFELLESDEMSSRLSAAGLLIDLLENREVRHLAEPALKRYIRNCEAGGGVEHIELLYDYRERFIGLGLEEELEKFGDTIELDTADTKLTARRGHD